MWKKLDAVMPQGALLYSNTSGIDIDIMANATKRPQDVAGTHFFAPANVMKLFEVVKGTKSANDVLASAMALGRKIGKVSGLAGNGDGFLANRSRAPFSMEMSILVEEGALPEQIDKVMVDYGYPVGPVRGVGHLGARYRLRHAQAPRRADPQLPQIADLRPHRRGRAAGPKTNAGWYRYEPGDRTPQIDPEVHTIIKDTAAEFGFPQREFSDDEILKRLLFASVNEACKILDEGARSRQRRRRDVAARLRLPALSRRPDVLGRHDRRARGLQPDRLVAPALRRPLAALRLPAPTSPRPAPR